MQKNTIDVVVTLASPLYEAYPGNYDKSKGLSYTMKKPVFANGKSALVPYYAANGFRGGLRRMIASRIADHLATTEGAISGDLYNGLRCGASHASPDQTALSIEEILRARKNVYMGLFGGGARIHDSMYQVSDMNPILDITCKAGMVPAWCAEGWVKERKRDDAMGYAEPWEIVGERHFVRKDDLYNVAKAAEVVRTVSEPVATVSAHQASVGLNKGERKEAGATKEDVANLQAFETIAEGTPMHFRITLDKDVTDAQVGAMLLALSDLFNENQFGGWIRAGMGKLRVQQMKMTLAARGGDESYAWDELNVEEGFSLPLDTSPFVTAALNEIAAITTKDIAGYFTDFSADKKSAAKAKKKAGTAEVGAA